MNKMEQLFQEQRRNLLSMMMYAKQGLPPTINSNKESMKQPLKEQNNSSSKQPKRNHDISSSRTRNNNNNSEKKMKQKRVDDVHF